MQSGSYLTFSRRKPADRKVPEQAVRVAGEAVN